MIGEAISLLEGLSQHKIAGQRAKAGLSNAYSELARIQVHSGNIEQAKSSCRKAISSARDVVAAVPDFKPARWGLVNGYQQLAELQENSGNLSDARISWQNAVENWRQFMEQDPSSEEYARSFASTLDNVARIDSRLGNQKAALNSMHESVNRWTLIVDRSPNLSNRLQLANALSTAADLKEQIGMESDAITTRRQSIELRESIASMHPDRFDLQRALVAEYEAALRSRPDDVTTCIGLSWFLATSENQEVRDPPRAIALPTKATSAAPENGFYWYATGVANYRNQDWSRAAEDFAKAIKYRNELSRGFAGFFIAMNQWRLDRKTAAQRIYQEAVTWMMNENPKDANLNRYQREAADLLELEPTP